MIIERVTALLSIKRSFLAYPVYRSGIAVSCRLQIYAFPSIYTNF